MRLRRVSISPRRIPYRKRRTLMASRKQHRKNRSDRRRTDRKNRSRQPDVPYLVGYGKPPVHSQFTKGTSGNPDGRPRGSKGLKALLRDALSKKIAVRDRRGVRKIPV